VTPALALILVACSTFALFRLGQPVLALILVVERVYYSEFLVQDATNIVQKKARMTVAQA